MEHTPQSPLTAIWTNVEDHALERQSPGLARARADATEAGIPQGSAAQAELLRALEHMVGATSVIVVGTGAVVETYQLLDGLDGHGQLTAVDSSAQGIAMIRSLLRELADSTQASLRAVSAPVKVFLPRLNAADYHLIVVAGDVDNYRATYEQAPRLLNKGGIIAFTDILAFAGQTADGAAGDGVGMDDAPDTRKADAMRQLLADVEEDERFESTLTPSGTGLLLAVKR
ncbi:methyltransferase [Bifidobacterium thermophilum]|nr:methyltransferase [Bifidobacterium thermophilum]